MITKYDWKDKLIYIITQYIGDDKTIKFIEKRKNNAIELGLFKKNDYIRVKVN